MSWQVKSDRKSRLVQLRMEGRGELEVREVGFVLSRDDGWISKLAGDSVVWYMQRYPAAAAKTKIKEELAQERIVRLGLMEYEKRNQMQRSYSRSGRLSVLSRGYREQHLMP